MDKSRMQEIAVYAEWLSDEYVVKSLAKVLKDGPYDVPAAFDAGVMAGKADAYRSVACLLRREIAVEQERFREDLARIAAREEKLADIVDQAKERAFQDGMAAEREVWSE